MQWKHRKCCGNGKPNTGAYACCQWCNHMQWRKYKHCFKLKCIKHYVCLYSQYKQWHHRSVKWNNNANRSAIDQSEFISRSGDLQHNPISQCVQWSTGFGNNHCKPSGVGNSKPKYNRNLQWSKCKCSVFKQCARRNI